MNAKFFVPFETAKALKAVGYNEKVNGYYTKGNDDAPCIANCGFPINNTDQETCNDISAPTYHEAVDWLENKGQCVVVDIDKEGWFAYNKTKNSISTVKGSYFKTREEALNDGILKALEIIKN